MDINVVILVGRLSAPPQISNDHNTVVRLLVAARSETPVKRLDLVPVIWWNPTRDELASLPEVGARVWISGSVQRRYWEGLDGRHSRIEVVAGQVALLTDDDLAAQCSEASKRP